MSDKTFVAGWWFWILGLILITGGILAVFKPIGMWWDRQVMLESHQYKEARTTENATFRAQLAQIEQRLMTEKDANIIADLQSQRAMLNSQMSISNARASQNGIVSNVITPRY